MNELGSEGLDLGQEGGELFVADVGFDPFGGAVTAALAAGGRLVSDEHAPQWWVLADAEGNEVCVATWVGRE